MSKRLTAARKRRHRARMRTFETPTRPPMEQDYEQNTQRTRPDWRD
ncbi:hypothetical protein [Serratia fonticola]|nr:hypothetical protein [Serratia fonticola]MDQ7212530.1 hypothetical protein [Serratia fonticola]HBE9082709.1 hypothetical protein [Serratia fonticola]HBE9093262.1 hypothetical protein [Serratia fonticola]HBE9155559.1 hypothetical protein [Serratia fonticola]